MNPGSYPLVSVLVPLYNHERFIRRCLDSILEDGYPFTEIIILDDGSKDGSVEAARAWHRENSHRHAGRFQLHSRENRGVTRTLNELVGMARGEFVILLASDDYLLPGGIQARADYLLENKGKMAVFADCIVVDQHNAVVHSSGINEIYQGRKDYLAHEKLRSYELVIRWCVPGPVFMARREAYRQFGGYDESLVVEDWDFYLRLLTADALGFVDYPVAAYRLHGGNAIYNKSRVLIMNDSMLRTVNNHLGNFTGVKKLFLFGTKLKLKGIHAKLTGRKKLRGVLSRRVGRTLISLTKFVHRRLIPIIIK